MASTAELASLAVLEFSVAWAWAAFASAIALFAASTEASGLNVVPGVVEDPWGGEVVGEVLDPVPWVGVDPGDDSVGDPDVDPDGGTLEDDWGELPIDVSDGCGELVGPDGDMLDDTDWEKLLNDVTDGGILDDWGEVPKDVSGDCGLLVDPDGGKLDDTDDWRYEDIYVLQVYSS